MGECRKAKDADGFHLVAIVEIESIYILHASNPFNKHYVGPVVGEAADRWAFERGFGYRYAKFKTSNRIHF